MVNDWFVQFSYLKKVYDQPIYKALNTGDPLNNGYPAVPALKAPDGRPIYNMTTYGAFKSGLYTRVDLVLIFSLLVVQRVLMTIIVV